MTAVAPVLLVGASGYLGSRIAAALRSSPRPVVALSDEVAFAGGDLLRAAVRDHAPASIVNAAGALRGTDSALEAANATLPATLAAAADEVGAHLVHLGSAAEYGLSGQEALSEKARCRPGSPYGRTKLDGTYAALDAHSVTVLRVFNLAALPPQADTPLADVIGRIAAAVAAGQPAALYSPDTVRDWVTPQFVVDSVFAAVDRRPPGLYNLCSGIGVRMGDAALVAMAQLGAVPALAPGHPAGPPVIGDPTAWRDVTGLAAQVTTQQLGHLMAEQIRLTSQ
ncbi:MAG: NAD-dependent epimerase/dehydratase family protein [Promicromonosporaceae bacterium]|nr:NAD-dependent epimerase/dehydratase family protein [Promicromonosporaceae bacterium]